MDRSLWLLLWLRSRAWFRRIGRDVRTLKGLLLVIVGALIFLPMIVSALVMPYLPVPDQRRLIERFGPHVMFGYCLLYVLLASGDRVIAYSPAETNFLFAGPYRPRQLLLYKIVRSIGDTAIASLFMILLTAHHAAHFLSAYVGLFLGFEFMFLFALAISLLTRTVGAFADNRLRRLALGLLVVVICGFLWQQGAEAFRLEPRELLARFEQAPIVRVLVWPFRPFPMAFISETLWPELATWGAFALGMDLALLLVVLGLDAQYVEASAMASNRLYARLERLRRSGAFVEEVKVRFALPSLPWWGGVGPNFWRQLTTASRSLNRLLTLLFLYLLPMLTIVLVIRFSGDAHFETDHFEVGYAGIVIWGSIVLFTPTMVGLDFRPDLDRMEEIKTLPIAPRALVLGQLLTPVLVITLIQWLALAALVSLAAVNPVLLAGCATLIVPLNLLLVEIENLFFLWYPTRALTGNVADFQGMGRQLILLMAKFAAATMAAAVAAGLGAAAYFLAGHSWPAALASAWIAALGLALALIPLLASAFNEFDVARDTPA